jgi:hypothetical protein
MRWSLLLLLLAGNAWADSITKSFTASVLFDENGKSVPVKSTVTWPAQEPKKGEVLLPLSDGSFKWVQQKEPAVEWCENFGTLQQVYNKKWELIDQYHLYELCGMSDHSVIWRRKAK